MLGGVGGHAGLFSNAHDVAVIMQMYLQKGVYDSKRFFSESTFELFNKCYYCDKGNRLGVGFDKPQIEGRGSTCGCLSKTSFGHSGFTGTYAWADPDKEIVFKSNETLNNCIEILNQILKNLTPNKKKMMSLAESGYVTATDLADYLVKNHNLSFRKAYQITASIVNFAEKKKKKLRELKIEELRKIEPKLTNDVFKVFDL